MESHQSSQEVTSHTLESIVSKEESCECDRETEHFRDSLTFSRVMEPTRAGLYTDQEKRRRKCYNTCDGYDQEQGEARAQSGLPQTWPELSSCPQGETAARGKEASEEPGKTLDHSP